MQSPQPIWQQVQDSRQRGDFDTPAAATKNISARYATARADIEANGPAILQDLLTATETQIKRMGAAWSDCERNSRRREVVTAWEATQGSGTP